MDKSVGIEEIDNFKIKQYDPITHDCFIELHPGWYNIRLHLDNVLERGGNSRYSWSRHKSIKFNKMIYFKKGQTYEFKAFNNFSRGTYTTGQYKNDANLINIGSNNEFQNQHRLNIELMSGLFIYAGQEAIEGEEDTKFKNIRGYGVSIMYRPITSKINFGLAIEKYQMNLYYDETDFGTLYLNPYMAVISSRRMQLHFPDFLLYGKFGVGLINGVRFDKSHNLKKFEKNVSSKLDVDFSCPFTFKVAMGMDYHINKNLSLNFEGGLLFAFVNSSWRINGQELFNDLPDETGYAHNVQLTVGLQFWAL